MARLGYVFSLNEGMFNEGNLGIINMKLEWICHSTGTPIECLFS